MGGYCKERLYHFVYLQYSTLHLVRDLSYSCIAQCTVHLPPLTYTPSAMHARFESSKRWPISATTVMQIDGGYFSVSGLLSCCCFLLCGAVYRGKYPGGSGVLPCCLSLRTMDWPQKLHIFPGMIPVCFWESRRQSFRDGC